MGDPDSLPPPSSPALQVLAERGLIEQASDFAATDAALSAGMVTFYNGYDPTASSLHAGSLLTIMAMRHLQKAGHRPLVLMGGATALVGDPSGRNETRKILDIETIKANSAALKRQFSRFVHFDTGAPNDAVMVDNSDWLLGVRYVEFIRDIGRHFTVNRMIAAKTYRDRLEAELPLSFLEFNYQLLQAYDFLHLLRAHDCRLQVGGSDQWGNMIAGVELIRRVAADSHAEGEQPDASAYCLTYPLLTTADGSKMGKTAKGAVWLDPERFSPFDYYQYWINCHDRDVETLLRIFTELPLEQVHELGGRSGQALNESKSILAFEATKLLHGEDEAARSRKATAQAFGKGEDWSALPCSEVPADELRLLDLVVHDTVKGFKSKRDARERIKSGAVKIDGVVSTDVAEMITVERCGEDGLRLQIGRKRRIRVKLVGAPEGGTDGATGEAPAQGEA